MLLPVSGALFSTSTFPPAHVSSACFQRCSQPHLHADMKPCTTSSWVSVPTSTTVFKECNVRWSSAGASPALLFAFPHHNTARNRSHLNLWPEGVGVALQHRVYSSLSRLLVLAVVEAVVAVAVVAVAAAGKALAVPATEGMDGKHTRGTNVRGTSTAACRAWCTWTDKAAVVSCTHCCCIWRKTAAVLIQTTTCLAQTSLNIM